MTPFDRRSPARQVRVENVSATCATSDGRFTVRVNSVTLLGAQISAALPVAKGDQVALTLSNHDPSLPRPAVVVHIEMACEVTWCNTHSDGFVAGLRFLYDGAGDMGVFLRFMHEQYGLRLWEWPDKREHPRVSRKLVCYYLDDDGVMQLAMLSDVSVMGLGLVTVQEIPLDTLTRFRFGVSEDMFLERKGRVVRSRKLDRGFDVGVVFVDFTEAERNELSSAVARAAED